MILNFTKVEDGLYRGSAPSVEDVKHLAHKFGIKKIVSLDEAAGLKINRICKLLNIEHLIIPLNMESSIKPLIKLFSHNIKDLLTKNGPVFVHCHAGKDRTGMLIALYKCKYKGWSCEDAITEAKQFGFGYGIPASITNLYEKLIHAACKKSHKKSDENKSDDIVEESRSEYTNSLMNTIDFKSFAPFLDSTRKYPNEGVYNPLYEQDQTRNNYITKEEAIPQVGIFDANSGMKGNGFVDAGGASTGILSEELV